MNGTSLNKILLFLSILIFAVVQGKASQGPIDSIRKFVSAMNSQKYKQAYLYISKPLQNEMSYGEFERGAKQVKSIKLISAKITHQTPRVAKARIMVQSLERNEENKKWERKKHIGELVFIPESGQWKVIQIDLKYFKDSKNKTRTN